MSSLRPQGLRFAVEQQLHSLGRAFPRPGRPAGLPDCPFSKGRPRPRPRCFCCSSIELSAIDLVCSAEILDCCPKKQRPCSLILGVIGCLESRVRFWEPQYIHVDDDSTLYRK
jgi:hypothetical protein